MHKTCFPRTTELRLTQERTRQTLGPGSATAISCRGPVAHRLNCNRLRSVPQVLGYHGRLFSAVACSGNDQTQIDAFRKKFDRIDYVRRQGGRPVNEYTDPLFYKQVIHNVYFTCCKWSDRLILCLFSQFTHLLRYAGQGIPNLKHDVQSLRVNHNKWIKW